MLKSERKPEPTPSPKAVIAWIAPGQVSQFFHDSMQFLMLRDRAAERHITNILRSHSGVNVSHIRNELTLQFLDENPQAEWLLWVDSDMNFEADAVTRLIDSADPVERPIVGGLCFGEDAETGLFPTIYVFQKDAQDHVQCIRLGDYPDDTMFEVAATGAAFLLIHRTALEAMRAQNFNAVFPFFQELEMYDKPVGEDIAFCARARATRTETWPTGIPIYVNTSVKIGHHKSHMLTAEKFRRQQGSRMVAPPATERVAVVVPTYQRPHNARPFMESLRASTGLATVYPMIDVDDTETWAAWVAAGAEPVASTALEFPPRCNQGYGVSSEPWVLIVGDDVRFHPGWLDAALYAAGDRYDVVGTNDLGNPRVVRGEHATHILLRRTYIDSVGGSWDGPGVLAHEGYGHWFVDDEIVSAAKARDTWISAHGSVIEHLHPLWGKAAEDDTYLKSQSTRFSDEELYHARLAENVPASVGTVRA